ncbi:MAG: alpha/beta fold hydrolase [Flavobacteriales bacterium]|nr:alpha/beta fold hydrolase [Flavobacteriales bacterium]
MALTPDFPAEGTPPEVQRKTFAAGEIVLEYAVWLPEGGPQRSALALHGFSRPLEDMLAVRPLLPKETAMVMVHLPAHGRSSGHHRPLDPAAWFEAVLALMEHEKLTFDGTLIGYSLGGRLALKWWSTAPERFHRVLLMAPDGLVSNIGYRFSVETALGRAWLVSSTRGRSRERMVAITEWLGRRGIIPEHFRQFSLFHLESAEMWNMVVDCWLSLRLFWPPGTHQLRTVAKAHPGVLEAHFGERDKVIKPGNAERLKGVCPVHFHPCGHGLLRPDIILRMTSPS